MEFIDIGINILILIKGGKEMINICVKERTMIDCVHCGGTGKCDCIRNIIQAEVPQPSGIANNSCMGICKVCEGHGRTPKTKRTILCSVGLFRAIWYQLFGKIKKEDVYESRTHRSS